MGFFIILININFKLHKHQKELKARKLNVENVLN